MCFPRPALLFSRWDTFSAMMYFLWSMRYGKVAEANPWAASGLEWMTTSPPPTFNFDHTPEVTWEAYDYEHIPAPESAQATHIRA
jgi:cytochrome c oxidase subunit 1